MTLVIRSAAVAAILAAFAVSARAQSTSSAMHFNIAAGATLPTGTFSDAVDLGYHVTGGIGLQDRSSSLGFRGEVSYNGFSGKNGGSNGHVTGFTANFSYDLGSAGATASKLYMIGGVGFYNSGGENGGSDTNFGWNVGGGFRFPLSGFSAYLEARFHSVSNTDIRYVPISFGLIF